MTDAAWLTEPEYQIDHVEYGEMIHGPGWSAIVETADARFGVSRYDVEDRWTKDSHILLRNGYPVFVNGQGSRCSARRFASDRMAAALDAAVADATCAECGGFVTTGPVGYDAAFRSDGVVVHQRCREVRP